ncbi:uncharacterized protein LOC129606184 [Condylostylus longicornis]|uniref:uncharacterized protein LOC129606184 n=1 Tax=Condylostylus longicornis TaxID=2530218 RepID=UPI00244DDCB2|nr:uncharacterized protein LOC129606184 [Condylostylus longicornis]
MENNNCKQITNNYSIFNSDNINYEIKGQKMSSILSSSSTTPLSHRFYQLFKSEKYWDCSFCIDDHIIKAHKLILATSSPVFEAMLYGPLNFNDNNNSTGIKTIRISDISPEMFYKLLMFIYTSELNFIEENIEDLIELYYCSEKYLIKDLQNEALLAIKRKLRFDNILQTLDLAIYTNFEKIIKICLEFFQQYCLSSENGARKFMLTIKSSYYHLSKDGVMEILNLLKDKKCKIYVYWFIKEWLRNDFDQKQQLQTTEFENISKDDQIKNNQLIFDNVSSNINAIIENEYFDSNSTNSNLGIEIEIGRIAFIERTYYKACQPFLVNETNNQFEVAIKSDQFISLIGLIIHSRLKPNPSINSNNRNNYVPASINYNNNNEYKESFKIEIYSIIYNSNGEKELVMEHSQISNNKIFTYNCDINILLNNKIVLIPDEKYIIKFLWDGRENKGAEYPCSLLSDKSGGISFEDRTTYNNGSILKGLKFLTKDKRD